MSAQDIRDDFNRFVKEHPDYSPEAYELAMQAHAAAWLAASVAVTQRFEAARKLAYEAASLSREEPECLLCGAANLIAESHKEDCAVKHYLDALAKEEMGV